MSELIMAKKPNLGYGNMRMPRFADGSVNMELVCKMVDTYMSHGFNYFDTAFTYKDAEAVLHKAVVERYPRDSFTVTDKLPIFALEKEEDLPRIFERSYTGFNGRQQKAASGIGLYLSSVFMPEGVR